MTNGAPGRRGAPTVAPLVVEAKLVLFSRRFCAILDVIMRTTLDIDDSLMEALMARHPGASKRVAVETAIREYLAQEAIERLRALKGKVDIKDLSADLRRDRRFETTS